MVIIVLIIIGMLKIAPKTILKRWEDFEISERTETLQKNQQDELGGTWVLMSLAVT